MHYAPHQYQKRRVGNQIVSSHHVHGGQQEGGGQQSQQRQNDERRRLQQQQARLARQALETDKYQRVQGEKQEGNKEIEEMQRRGNAHVGVALHKQVDFIIVELRTHQVGDHAAQRQLPRCLVGEILGDPAQFRAGGVTAENGEVQPGDVNHHWCDHGKKIAPGYASQAVQGFHAVDEEAAPYDDKREIMQEQGNQARQKQQYQPARAGPLANHPPLQGQKQQQHRHEDHIDPGFLRIINVYG